jgi:hypothetical protein
MRNLFIFAALSVSFIVIPSCKNPLSDDKDGAATGYQLSIQSNSYWEYWYSSNENVTYTGHGNTTRDVNKQGSPTCIVIANTRSTGYITASMLKGGKAIDSGTSNEPFGHITVCSD